MVQDDLETINTGKYENTLYIWTKHYSPIEKSF